MYDEINSLMSIGSNYYIIIAILIIVAQNYGDSK